jgi:hypothetical protein
MRYLCHYLSLFLYETVSELPTFYHSTTKHAAQDGSGNAPVLYSEGAWFESHPGIL